MARLAALAGLVFAALLVRAMILERLVFARAANKAANDVKLALSAADMILLEDEQLTMSANLAAQSGDARWIERYDLHIPLIDKAIKAATEMAPAGAAERFDHAPALPTMRSSTWSARPLLSSQQVILPPPVRC